ncbi:MAG TPA: hypothetical protein VGD23_03870 [Sphingomicrobium sp.]
MSFLLPLALALTAGGSASAVPARQPSLGDQQCPEATSHFAGKGSAWRGQGLRPRKLIELPPAEAFAAVYRRDERGCVVPVKYRDVRR